MARTTGLSFYKRRKKISSKLVKEILSWIFSIAATILVAVVLVYFYGMRSNVVGQSMEPGLIGEQEILIDRFCYQLRTPKVGDVVLFLPNGNVNTHYYTKRVVAMGGDTVQILDGVLYVNGIRSTEISGKISEPGIAENELVLEPGEYFVLGDQPSISEDSRSANIGPVSGSDIVGKVWFALSAGRNKMHFVK